jgi:CRP-like cAMP-binding protein
MTELLLKSFVNKVSATQEESDEFKSYFTARKLKKKQFLLQEGDVCNKLAFVEKGALYSYSTDLKGAQHVIQFAFEGWWISDLYSFFTQEPSKLNIEALEASELLLIDHEKHQLLLSSQPKYESYMRLLYQNAYVALQKRVESTIGLTAEEKYSRLLEHYPALLHRMPLQLIASYLGVTPETLSRIRKQLSF